MFFHSRATEDISDILLILLASTIGKLSLIFGVELGKSKLSKLIKTGNIYMKKNSFDSDYEYDAILVTPDGIFHIEHLTI